MRTIFIFLLFLSSIIGSKAQTFSINSLIGTKWEQIEENDAYTKTIIEFNDTAMIETVKFFVTKNTCHVSRPYYLSKEVPVSFNRNLVGKKTTGSYLVMLYKFNRMDYMTIKKITSDTLLLFHRQTNAIGGYAHTFVYKRIKST
ncbi:hypothetical protein HPS54_05865 [Prevotella sp. PCHR]|uniref:Lipocalin-like domain-containing protein n=1 Tax=Xylanibacter caecicola TaxID=2736294 RepID=A0ABX2B0U7_9BACT|nr:hypothetical protein [Xylanibacter caecicola]NPE25046.1 hypothetical protein [Xylanibacter caecicola]